MFPTFVHSSVQYLFYTLCLNLVASCASVPLPARPGRMQNRLYTSWNREELYNVKLMKCWDSRCFKSYSLCLGSLDTLYTFLRCKDFQKVTAPLFLSKFNQIYVKFGDQGGISLLLCFWFSATFKTVTHFDDNLVNSAILLLSISRCCFYVAKGQADH